MHYIARNYLPARYRTAARLHWLLIIVAFPLLAISEEFSASGTIESINNHNFQPIAEGHVVLFASMEETLVMNDISNPWNGATGICGGAAEIKAGGIEGNGLCTFEDKAGDKFVISWMAESLNEKGGPQGVWKLVSGTGRYQNASAGGQYSDIPSEDPKISSIDLTGTLSLK